MGWKERGGGERSDAGGASPAEKGGGARAGACAPGEEGQLVSLGNGVRREGRQTRKDLSLDWREKSLETGPGCLP